MTPKRIPIQLEDLVSCGLKRRNISNLFNSPRQFPVVHKKKVQKCGNEVRPCVCLFPPTIVGFGLFETCEFVFSGANKSMGIVNLPDNSMIDRAVNGNKDWQGEHHPKLSCKSIANSGMEHSRPAPANSCTLAVLGDPKVGKTSLINRVISGKYLDQPNGNGSIGRKEPLRWNFTVAGKSINYSIWDFSGTTHADLAIIDPHSKNGTNLTRVFQQLDVVLICYDIADPDTLFSALNCWVPKIKTLTLSKEKMTNEVPIILVGCQSDARQDRDSPGSTIPHPNLPASRRPLSFGRDLPSPVSANQALKLSQQSGCSLYVETSARECSRSAISAFEVAALVTLGQLQQHPPLLQSSPAPPIPPKAVKISPPVPPKPRRAVSHMALNKENIYTPEPLKQKSVSKVNIFPSSPKLSLKTSKNRSSASLLSLSSQRTPKIPRKSGKHERMITIKCQRLNSAKEYEEVEVEVPEPVYETLRYQNDPSGARQEMALNKAKRNTFTSKIRNMFLKT